VRVLVFDLETDGLIKCNKSSSEKWPRVIEFCGLAYCAGELSGALDELVDPGRLISKEITEITGLENGDLEGRRKLPALWPEIKALIEGCDRVVAHNAGFDTNVLNLEALRLGLEPINWPELFCTVENTEHILSKRMKLAELHEHLFSEGFKGAHRARADVEATARCYFKLMGEVKS
jgi:DNA polymerase III epsilon subunit-like protein